MVMKCSIKLTFPSHKYFNLEIWHRFPIFTLNQSVYMKLRPVLIVYLVLLYFAHSVLQVLEDYTYSLAVVSKKCAMTNKALANQVASLGSQCISLWSYNVQIYKRMQTDFQVHFLLRYRSNVTLNLNKYLKLLFSSACFVSQLLDALVIIVSFVVYW